MGNLLLLIVAGFILGSSVALIIKTNTELTETKIFTHLITYFCEKVKVNESTINYVCTNVRNVAIFLAFFFSLLPLLIQLTEENVFLKVFLYAIFWAAGFLFFYFTI
ncbi:MAG: hypothetical protein QXQ14_02110 [Candidatus Aenigmatarchaeota archaeon]